MIQYPIRSLMSRNEHVWQQQRGNAVANGTGFSNSHTTYYNYQDSAAINQSLVRYNDMADQNDNRCDQFTSQNFEPTVATHQFQSWEETAPKAPNWASITQPNKSHSESESLKFAILDKRHPTGKIIGENQSLLCIAWNHALANAILTSHAGSTPIQIEFARFMRDIYRINLVSTEHVNALKDLVEKLPPLWHGSKLSLVALKEKVALYKTTFFLQLGDQKNQRKPLEVLKILERQNLGLMTEAWGIFHVKKIDGGVLYVVGIDEKSVNFIKRCGGHLFFLSSTITVRMNATPLRVDSKNVKSNGDWIPKPKNFTKEPQVSTRKQKMAVKASAVECKPIDSIFPNNTSRIPPLMEQPILLVYPKCTAGSQIKWYRRFIAEGLSPNEARRKVYERKTKTV